METMPQLLTVFFLLLSLTTAHAETTTRVVLLAESLYSNSDVEQQTDQPVWEHVVASLNLPGVALSGDTLNNFNQCQYTEALATLHQILLQQGGQSAYLRQWILNQNKVFLACDNPTPKDTPPIQLIDKSWPLRADSDYLYQLASWKFYKQQYQEALTIYQRVASLNNAPQRPNATYMVVRTLAHLGQTELAYAKIAAILADPSLKSVHAIAENYRFVIMSNSNLLGQGFVAPALAIDHLRWLLSLIEANPQTAQNVDLALKNSADAMLQINSYFPLYDPDSLAVDWWLNPKFANSSARMLAVITLAATEEIIDWKQAQWAYNAFDTDWLWALHQPQNPYWLQNQHIVAHAWTRWQQSHHGEWLQIALQRIRPDDPLAPIMVDEARAYLIHNWKNATPEYRKWIFDLWQHSLRIDLGRKQYPQALQLIEQYSDYQNLWPVTSGSDYVNSYQSAVLNNVLQWLVYVGADDQARLFLATIRQQYKDGAGRWKVLLATNLTDAFEPTVQANFFNNVGNNSPVLWQDMVNQLPTKVLYDFAGNKQVGVSERAGLARTALTRAILLNMDDAAIDQYAVLAAKLNPSIQSLILESVASHQRSRYLSMLLKLPRFRPAPYLTYTDTNSNWTAGSQITLNPYEIDQFNHNDNNWWCRFDPALIKRMIFDEALISPKPSKIFPVAESIYPYQRSDNSAIEVANPEFKPYYDNQRALLAQHPYQALIDVQETVTLAAIPSGPQYLSDAVDSREQNTFFMWRWFMSIVEKNRRAEDLHNAVRSTRFGCNKDGSPALYSKASFNLIHEFYPDTTWAKATPYWFGLPELHSMAHKSYIEPVE